MKVMYDFIFFTSQLRIIAKYNLGYGWIPPIFLSRGIINSNMDDFLHCMKIALPVKHVFLKLQSSALRLLLQWSLVDRSEMNSGKIRDFRDRLATLHTLSDYLGELSELTTVMGCRSYAFVVYLKPVKPMDTDPSRFVFSTSANLDWIAGILSLSASCWAELLIPESASVKHDTTFATDTGCVRLHLPHSDRRGFSLLCFERQLNGCTSVELSPQLAGHLLAYAMQFNSSMLRDQAGYFCGVGQSVLSQRERELLRLLSQGYTRKEISQLRHKAIGTVDKQLGAVLRKLGARNAIHAVALAAKRKLIV